MQAYITDQRNVHIRLLTFTSIATPLWCDTSAVFTVHIVYHQYEKMKTLAT